MSATSFSIGKKSVGQGQPCFVIAEVAQAHDGSVGHAHAYVDAAADIGASAIKFQTHIAAEESTRSEPWRVHFSRQDHTRFEYWQRMEFSAETWIELADHARERGIEFLSSPFSSAAVELLEKEVDVPAWKIASGEIGNLPMLEEMAATGKPLLLSSGLATWDDLDAAVAIARAHDVPFAIFQTTSEYPCPPERVGLNVLEQLRSRYGCPVGLSDHSATTHACLAAVALGADLVEAHIVFSRRAFGPDTTSSLEPSEFRFLVDGAHFVKQALQHPVDKDGLARELEDMRRLFSKSVVARRALTPGTRLRATDLAAKKPGTGIPAAELPRIIGRVLRRPVAADAQLSEDDLG